MHCFSALIRLLLPVCAAAAALQAAAAPPSTAKVRETLAAASLRFEANAGQWAPEIRYRARAGAYALSLTDKGASLSFAGREIGMTLAGSSAPAAIEPAGKLAAPAAFFLGNRRETWRTGVPQYGGVRYRAIYPGIDLVWYGNGREVEYDFLLQPGADPSRIRMRFRGADRLSLTPAGDLALEAAGSRLLQKRPVVYQQDASGERREIAAHYVLAGRDTARVALGDYDRSRPLTIDPVLQYSALFGGERGDAVTAVKIDRDGIVWVAGYTTDGGISATPGAYKDTFAGSTDIFVAAIDPRASGGDSLKYFTYIGGKGADVPNDMALDADGNVYLTGSTTSSDFPLGGFAAQNLPASTDGTADAFVLKLRPAAEGDGALAYASYLGGSGLDEGRGIAVDAAGFIYIIGTTRSENFKLTGSARQNIRWGPQDAFFAKFNPNALSDADALMYSTYIGGEGYDDGRSIAVGPDGIAYLTGTTSSTQFPWAGVPYSAEPVGGGDIWIARMDATKSGEVSALYASYFGGTSQDEVRRIALDADGKVLLTGATLSSDFPVTGGAYRDSAPGGGGDVFLTRLDLTAPRSSAVLYSTYLGGSGGDVGYDIALDPSGAVWLTGYTLSRDFPVTRDAVQTDYPGGTDVFVTKLDPSKAGDAALLYSTYLGQINIHVAYAVAAGADGTVAVGGVTGQPSVKTTDNAVRRDYAGGLADGFVVVIAP